MSKERPASSTVLLVEPGAQGRWTVRRAGEHQFISHHDTASDATRAAHIQQTPVRVLLRDRYDRVHALPV